MPDWNPAEMIGRVPRQLALSLYQKLITNNAWIKARDEMGYFNPGYDPLIVPLFGQPYIDTRLSFNSFLPKGTEIGLLDHPICVMAPLRDVVGK